MLYKSTKNEILQAPPGYFVVIHNTGEVSVHVFPNVGTIRFKDVRCFEKSMHKLGFVSKRAYREAN